jgi:hypothetical protein
MINSEEETFCSVDMGELKKQRDRLISTASMGQYIHSVTTTAAVEMQTRAIICTCGSSAFDSGRGELHGALAS